MSGASSTVGGAARAGGLVYQPRVDADTVEKISGTVQTLVKELLDKSYFNETCLAVFTNPGFNEAAASGDIRGLKGACLEYWKQKGVEAVASPN
jgi:hypothetical protein